MERINNFGVKILAQVCAERRIPLCHISTAQVFSGYQGRHHHPKDEPKPLSFHATTKLKGERHVRKLPRHLIVRTSWLFGGSSSFVTEMMKKAQEKEVIVEGDQFSRPTYAKDLAQAIEALIEASIVGTVHFANEGWCSKAEWAEEIFKMLDLDVKVQAAPTKQTPGHTAQSKYTVLDIVEYPWLINRNWRYSLAEHLRESGHFVV